MDTKAPKRAYLRIYTHEVDEEHDSTKIKQSSMVRVI